MKVVRAFEELGVGVGKPRARQTPRALPQTPFSAMIPYSRIMGEGSVKGV